VADLRSRRAPPPSRRIVIQPTNLALLGLAAPHLVAGAGQFIADSIHAMADRAVTPFHDLLNAAPVTISPTAAGATAEKSPFGQLYRSVEEDLRLFLSRFPELPSVRVQILSGGQFRVTPTDETNVTADELQRIGQAESQLNDNFRLTDAADALQQAKARAAWRSGMTGTTDSATMVEFLFH